ncbi:hypothetical protein XENOCAPTIV_004291 [Xenoophorus captivus]|uniref:Uncharacterized protein n=1 Tax=Xenoophorus captivus TaxID=1517983 RepID=A0ABV0RFH2_9TELE
MGLLSAESPVNGLLVSLFHSVGVIQRVLKITVVLGEQVVQKTRSKMDSLVSGMEASRGNVIQATTEVLLMAEVTTEVLVMAEVSSQEKLHGNAQKEA